MMALVIDPQAFPNGNWADYAIFTTGPIAALLCFMLARNYFTDRYRLARRLPSGPLGESQPNATAN